MYTVVKPFADAFDNGHIYRVGDVYPRTGATPSVERLEELSSNRNKTGRPVIVEEEHEEGVSEVKEDASEEKAGVSTPNTAEAKKRPRKGQGKNA